MGDLAVFAEAVRGVTAGGDTSLDPAVVASCWLAAPQDPLAGLTPGAEVLKADGRGSVHRGIAERSSSRAARGREAHHRASSTKLGIGNATRGATGACSRC